jgi:VanZ family protein
MLTWIFSNSLKTSVESGEESVQVTEQVYDVIQSVNPDVSFGGATEEEDFNILHGFVRNFAHFAEFALLCALVTWCVLSYTKIKYYFIIPLPLCVGLAFFDEYLQTFSEGRAQEFTDVLIDCLGACAGFAFALLTIWIGFIVYKRVLAKKQYLPVATGNVDADSQ